MWTALFGMAVMAVDFGYLYTKKRGLQSAADAALLASMPAFTGAELHRRERHRHSGGRLERILERCDARCGR